MRTCPSCGRFITDASASVCPNCGASLASDVVASAPSQPAAPEASQPAAEQAPSASLVPSPPQPAGQPTYAAGYGAQSGYPGAYRPGMDWKPSQGSTPRPWGRIFGGIVAALVVIAVVAGFYTQLTHKPPSPTDLAPLPTVNTNTSGVLLNDSMLTEDNGWSHDSHCYFDTDGYHIHGAYYCAAPIDDRSDGTETVTTKQLIGSTNSMYGLVFGLQDETDFYLFGINASGQWAVFRDVNGGVTSLKSPTINIAIKGGLNTANTLSVTISGSTFTFYVNGQKLGAVTDTTFPRGEWGVAAVGDKDLNVVFTNYVAHK